MDRGLQRERAAADRHKRFFNEMSRESRSPSPIESARPAYLTSSTFPSIPPNSHRQRTSHPHSQPRTMGDRNDDRPSQGQIRPRLEHRASQTVIDLTDDEPIEPPRGVSRPPQLGRSDAVNLIDLTDDDDEPDVIITEVRNGLPPPRRTLLGQRPDDALLSHLRQRRDGSPPLFVQQDQLHDPARRRPPGVLDPGTVPDMRHWVAAIVREQQLSSSRHNHLRRGMNPPDFLAHMAQVHGMQMMPVEMNYAQPAFANRTPEHVAPKPARDGFTRSPKESDTIICPSCETELIHNKETIEEPVVKRGKAPTKKEREEHPFWVVKECGHVYCNSCYQRRDQAGKQPNITFVATTKQSSGSKSRASKVLQCAVDDCDCDVKNKDKWVGIFL